MAPYPAYPVPADEDQRLRELERYCILDADSDEHFERILDLTAAIFRTPIVAISLVEADRQWFLARRGLAVRETPREMAFCAHAIVHDDVMVVPDARDDERFRSNAGRVQHRDTLLPQLRRVLAQRATDAWVTLLADRGIPIAPINGVAEALNDPQVRARAMVQPVTHPTLGVIDQLGPVAKLSHTPATITTAPPTLGADTNTVLQQLGYSAEQIAYLLPLPQDLADCVAPKVMKAAEDDLVLDRIILSPTGTNKEMLEEFVADC